MSQNIFSSINPTTTSGTDLATLLNDFKEAMVSGMSGTARPTELDPGGFWIDMVDDPVWYFKLWDGTQDTTIFTVDTTSGTTSFGGSSSEFTITKTSADAVGAFLTLVKQRLINNGQVLSGDDLGTIRFKGDADDGSVTTAGKIRVAAAENFTATNGGVDLIIELTSAGSVVASEVLRIRDGNIGLGVTPVSKLDFTGAQNIREMSAPSVSASGASKLYMDSTSKKVRLSENGGAYKDLSPTRRSGQVAMTVDSDEVQITFSSTMGTTSYSHHVGFENTTDSEPIFIQYLVIEKTALGMKLRVTNPPTANYVATYKVETYE